MLDRERILGKIAELDSYLGELKQVTPATFDVYQAIEKKRSCERLLQLSIESAIDDAKWLFQVSSWDYLQTKTLFSKLHAKKIISEAMAGTLREMKGFRNILIHEYATVDDEVVYSYAKMNINDFEEFEKQILASISS